MKRLLVAVCLLLASTIALAQTTFRGTWSADLSRDKVMLRTDFNYGDNHYGNSFEISRAEFRPGATPNTVSFRVVRDAGTFTYTGTVKENLGSGFVDFVPNPEFAPGMAQLGIRI
jgi:hypothetical protein